MAVIIQKLKLADFDQFYTFARDFVLRKYLDFPPAVRRGYWRSEFDKAGLKEAIQEGEIIILLAVADQKIIGFTYLTFETGGGAILQWLVVDKDYRGQGVGSQLLSEAEIITKKKKNHFLYLWTESQKNIDYYKKRGFYLVGRQKEAWFGLNENLLQKNLCPPFSKQWEKNEA